MEAAPTLDEIRQARRQLGDRIRHTPTWAWSEGPGQLGLGPGSEVLLKLELFQHAGSFKSRAALLHADALDDAQRARGMTTVSAGNHARALAYAAAAASTTAKVVMPRSANPARIAACRALGAAIVLVDDVHQAFEVVRRIELEEGRTFVHPFEGKTTALGTATVGLEMIEDAGPLDAVVVPIGGGGLCAGVAVAVKAACPSCRVYGVEPEGADSMHRSFAAGRPEAIERVTTIADSLGAPHAAPYSFELCRAHVDELVKVDDDAICRAMVTLFGSMKLAVEPAGAAATAALAGPLARRLSGKRVGLVVCGSNIDADTFTTHLRRGLSTVPTPT